MKALLILASMGLGYIFMASLLYQWGAIESKMSRRDETNWYDETFNDYAEGGRVAGFVFCVAWPLTLPIIMFMRLNSLIFSGLSSMIEARQAKQRLKAKAQDAADREFEALKAQALRELEARRLD